MFNSFLYFNCINVTSNIFCMDNVDNIEHNNQPVFHKIDKYISKAKDGLFTKIINKTLNHNNNNSLLTEFNALGNNNVNQNYLGNNNVNLNYLGNNKQSKFAKVKSNVVCRLITKFMPSIRVLKTFNYNKSIQKRINLSIDDYIDISSDIVVASFDRNLFINKGVRQILESRFRNNEHRLVIDTVEEPNKVIVICCYGKRLVDPRLPKCLAYYLYEAEEIGIVSKKPPVVLKNLFSGAHNVKYINMQELNAEYVKDITGMFENCVNLEQLDLSKFKINNLEKMSNLFYGCTSLETLDIPYLNTTSVKDMSNVFYECSNLKHLRFNFNTENVIDMVNMFYGCRNLKYLDLSEFYCPNLRNISGMFVDCSDLEDLDIRRFSSLEIIYANETFKNCKSLENVYVNQAFSLDHIVYKKEILDYNYGVNFIAI